MVPPYLQRLALITGESALQKLCGCSVIIFGLGGVGSWCAEALARSGVGAVTLVDSDTVCVTNINRQVEATTKTIGQAKTEALKIRLEEINPACRITALTKVFSLETAASFEIEKYDYAVDAIDSLTNKLDLIELCAKLKDDGKRITLFSCMGMAQKLNPARIKVSSVWETSGCPLARLVRTGLRKRSFLGDLTVVYSNERLPLQTDIKSSCGSAQCLCPSKNKCGEEGGQDSIKEWCSSKKVINGSAVTVTATAGMLLAGLVMQDCVLAP